mgnify:CR=1 FL=1
MIISIHKDNVLFRTDFSKDFYLTQKFRGATEIDGYFNSPVDFTEAGLMYKNKNDIWHIDVPLAYSTDETPPVMINGHWLGGNHIFPFAVALLIPRHGKTVADIGSLWQDVEGTKWTIVNVSGDVITVISENIGESECKYDFKTKVSQRLTYVENGKNTEEIDADVESWCSAMSPSIRHTKRKIIAYTDRKPQTVYRTTECDYAEIHEDYEIVNPVSMVEEIRKNRPKEGYPSCFYGAMGKTMVSVSRIYRIEADGTIVCDFKIKKHMDVHMSRCMGAMFQEKLNTYGGNLYRYIPKTKPFAYKDDTFDFTSPVPIEKTADIPKNQCLIPELWEDINNPPDRITDYFRNINGDDVMGFSCGYLPVLKGVPEIRTRKLSSAVLFGGTRKAYPVFMEGDIEECHGIAYRKYFDIDKNRTSVYTVPYGGKTYLYVDLFENSTVTVPVSGDVKLYEKSDNISYTLENGNLTVSGKGYSTFIY